MFGMWIKKWSRIRGIARHKVCMVLPISLLFEQNLPPFQAISANSYYGETKAGKVTIERNENEHKLQSQRNKECRLLLDDDETSRILDKAV